MTWNNFIFFAIGTLTFWSAGCYMAWKKKYHTESLWIFAAGILLLLSFILGLGIFLQRPPIRTMGETRLLYSFYGSYRLVDIPPPEICMASLPYCHNSQPFHNHKSRNTSNS